MATKESKLMTQKRDEREMHSVEAVRKPGPYSRKAKLKPAQEEQYRHGAECGRCGRKGNHECRATKAKCYKCGRIGHFASKCRSRSVQPVKNEEL